MDFGLRFEVMTGFWKKDKGFRGKEKVARLVDNRIAVVDKCLHHRRPFADTPCGFAPQRLRWQAFLRFCACISAKGDEQNKFCFSASGGSARIKSKPQPYLPKQQALCWADSVVFVGFKPAVSVNRNSTAQFVAILANSAAIGCGLLRLIGRLRLISFVKQGCGLLRAFLSNYLLVF